MTNADIDEAVACCNPGREKELLDRYFTETQSCKAEDLLHAVGLDKTGVGMTPKKLKSPKRATRGATAATEAELAARKGKGPAAAAMSATTGGQGEEEEEEEEGVAEESEAAEQETDEGPSGAYNLPEALAAMLARSIMHVQLYTVPPRGGAGCVLPSVTEAQRLALVRSFVGATAALESLQRHTEAWQRRQKPEDVPNPRQHGVMFSNKIAATGRYEYRTAHETALLKSVIVSSARVVRAAMGSPRAVPESGLGPEEAQTLQNLFEMVRCHAMTIVALYRAYVIFQDSFGAFALSNWFNKTKIAKKGEKRGPRNGEMLSEHTGIRVRDMRNLATGQPREVMRTYPGDICTDSRIIAPPPRLPPKVAITHVFPRMQMAKAMAGMTRSSTLCAFINSVIWCFAVQAARRSMASDAVDDGGQEFKLQKALLHLPTAWLRLVLQKMRNDEVVPQCPYGDVSPDAEKALTYVDAALLANTFGGGNNIAARRIGWGGSFAGDVKTVEYEGKEVAANLKNKPARVLRYLNAAVATACAASAAVPVSLTDAPAVIYHVVQLLLYDAASATETALVCRAVEIAGASSKPERRLPATADVGDPEGAALWFARGSRMAWFDISATEPAAFPDYVAARLQHIFVMETPFGSCVQTEIPFTVAQEGSQQLDDKPVSCRVVCMV